MASAGEVSRLANALYSLQKQYLHLVENEDPECDSAFNYYNELSEELKKKCEASMKYSNMLVQNPHYQEAFQAGNGNFAFILDKP